MSEFEERASHQSFEEQRVEVSELISPREPRIKRWVRHLIGEREAARPPTDEQLNRLRTLQTFLTDPESEFNRKWGSMEFNAALRTNTTVMKSDEQKNSLLNSLYRDALKNDTADFMMDFPEVARIFNASFHERNYPRGYRTLPDSDYTDFRLSPQERLQKYIAQYLDKYVPQQNDKPSTE